MAAEKEESVALPPIRVDRPEVQIDFVTIFGLLLTIGLVLGAIFGSSSDANFFNVPAIMMVVLGTMTATATSFTADELAQSWKVIGGTVKVERYNASKVAKSLMDIAVTAKKKGLLSLASAESEMDKFPFLSKSIQIAVDGYLPDYIKRVLELEIDAQEERHKRAASITQRASEVAPAMGLIGTLVGLVQMLAELENPESIGPAMALALLTTFYGALMGTIIMAPLSVKLEKYSSEERIVRRLVMVAAISISKQENPRSLEMQLNSELPPSKQIKYFT